MLPIFTTANTFFQLNLIYVADSRTGFRSRHLWKYELNIRSSRWSCFIKEYVQNILAHFTGKHLCWIPFLIELSGLQLCSQHSCFLLEFRNVLRTPTLKNISERLLLKPVQISHGLSFFVNLHFWLKLVHASVLNPNFHFHLPILPSLLLIMLQSEAVTQWFSAKKDVLKNFEKLTRKHLL